MSRWSRFAPLLLVAGSTAFSLGLIELALRVLGPGSPQLYQADSLTGYGLRPQARGRWSQEGSSMVRINRQGFHDRDWTSAPPTGTLRIAVMGDSFTEALQVEEGESWVKRLPAALAATTPCPLLRSFPGGAETLNFGVGGYGTGQSWLSWQRDARPLNPRLVLHAVYFENDLRDNLVGGSATAAAPTFHLQNGTLVVDTSFRQRPDHRFRLSPLGQAASWALAHSRLLQLVKEGRDRLRPAAGAECPASGCSAFPLGTDGILLYGPDSGDLEPGWGVLEAILQRWNTEARQAGATLVVTSLTTPPQLWPDTAERRRQAERHQLDWMRPERRLAGILAAQGIPYLPLAPALQRQADTKGLVAHGFAGQRPGPGYGHWNRQGHRAAATVLAQQLCALKAPTP
ncbi:MAG: SGNH/GDSL hydrolase family protein [Cyanobacteriota bacterium]|nr:SGNH/GDSL hydrolase family protein [Cyanobacteriota bacterium]